MLCKVRGCRFNQTHLTFYHKCGNCNIYGHGRYECCYDDDKQHLYQQFMTPDQVIPYESHCQIETCQFPWSHQQIAHHCSLCGKNGHDKTSACEYIIHKKCPICNGHSNINIKNRIFTDIDCVICMEGEKKKVVFENCGHAQVCEECVVQL